MYNTQQPIDPDIDELVDEATLHSKSPIWTKQHECILADWADKAACYRWLYNNANQIFSRFNTLFTIPVIIMSTLTGTANFAQDRVPQEYRSIFTMAIGCVNIVAGIMTTIQQFLKISELNEAHRVASISWDKLYRNIRVELSKHPDERIPVVNFIKITKDEFDRLMETSPQIPQQTLRRFQNQFVALNVPESKLTETQRIFRSVQAPDICGTIKPSKETIFVPDTKPIVSYRNRHPLLDIVTQKLKMEQREKQANNIIDRFRNEYNRDPTMDELEGMIDESEHSSEHSSEHRVASKFLGKMRRMKNKTLPDKVVNSMIDQVDENKIELVVRGEPVVENIITKPDGDDNV